MLITIRDATVNMKKKPSKGVEVHTYGGSDEEKLISPTKKYSVHMKRSFIAKVKSSKEMQKIPKNSIC